MDFFKNLFLTEIQELYYQNQQQQQQHKLHVYSSWNYSIQTHHSHHHGGKVTEHTNLLESPPLTTCPLLITIPPYSRGSTP